MKLTDARRNQGCVHLQAALAEEFLDRVCLVWQIESRAALIFKLGAWDPVADVRLGPGAHQLQPPGDLAVVRELGQLGLHGGACANPSENMNNVS